MELNLKHLIMNLNSNVKEIKTKSCQVCESSFVPFTSFQKYCSRKCKSKADNAKRSKKPPTKTCKHCEQEFKPYTSLDKFCSTSCRIANMKSKRKSNWTEQQVKRRMGKNNPAYRTGNYTLGSKRSAVGQREFLRVRNQMRAERIEEHGYLFCEHCKTSDSYQWEMHHLVYRSEKPGHKHLHNPLNLIDLCVKCHNLFHKDKSTRNEIVRERKLHLLFGNDVLDKESKKSINHSKQ